MEETQAPGPHAARLQEICQRWPFSKEQAEKLAAASLDDELIELVVRILPHTTIGLDGAIGVALRAQQERAVARRQKALAAQRMARKQPGQPRQKRPQSYASSLLENFRGLKGRRHGK